MKVVELFAGVGGFRIGLEKASEEFEVIWANQYEPSRKKQDAFECYVKRFGDLESHSNEDINKVNVKDIPDHDLLVGGFPCQDYSVASTNAEGIQGKKGVLWWNIHEIAGEKRPKFMLLENVDRLLKSPSKQKGRDFGIILSTLDQLGYSVEWKVINAADCGLNQKRKRVFIFAFRNDTEYKELLNAENKGVWIYQKSLFSKMYDFENYKGRVNGYVDIRTEDIKKFSDEFNCDFYNSGIMSDGVVYMEDTKCLDEHTGKMLNVLEDEVEEKYYLGDGLDDWEYMKGAKKIPRKVGTPHEYVFAEGKIAFPDHIDRPSRTMLTSEASKNRSTHIVLDPGTDRLRKITPLECERLNGFPDNWTDTGMSERFRYFCMGNALVVDIIERLGREIIKLN